MGEFQRTNTPPYCHQQLEHQQQGDLMKILLVGREKEALQIYQRLLASFGIEADVGECWSNEHTIVIHLWPMHACQLREQLCAASGAEDKQKSAG
ncbi:MAG: hypothetical protein KGH79_00785 [Patescibacteria group bacterium]|nr:hypothetical protein [Patescibacteria group bacterium]